MVAGTDMMFMPWCTRSSHNAALPAAGLSGPPGPGIRGVSACWYCGEEKKRTWSNQRNALVMLVMTMYPASGGVLMSHTYPKERAEVIWITCCTFRCADTSPCFQTVPSVYELPSANNTEETYCPLVLSNICQMSLSKGYRMICTGSVYSLLKERQHYSAQFLSKKNKTTLAVLLLHGCLPFTVCLCRLMCSEDLIKGNKCSSWCNGSCHYWRVIPVV